MLFHLKKYMALFLYQDACVQMSMKLLNTVRPGNFLNWKSHCFCKAG